jgi:hypothetical protein
VDALHLTATVVLAAAAVLCGVIELVCCVAMLRRKAMPAARPMVAGLLAAVGAHLAVYAMTGQVWGAAVCVLPFLAVVVLCIPRTWQPPPRLARLARAPLGELMAPPELPAVLENDQVSWTSTAGEVVVKSVDESATAHRDGSSDEIGTEQSAPLTASERQAWESLRRSLGEL